MFLERPRSFDGACACELETKSFSRSDKASLRREYSWWYRGLAKNELHSYQSAIAQWIRSYRTTSKVRFTDARSSILASTDRTTPLRGTFTKPHRVALVSPETCFQPL